MKDDDVCGIGRCRHEPDQGRIWSIPICVAHWEQCCREDIESLRWLHKHAKREFASKLPPFVPRVPAAQPVSPARVVRRPAPPPVASEPRRAVRKPVRIPKLPVKIPKP